MLVYGFFLLLVGVTAMFQAILVSAHFSNTTLNSIVGNDSATVRTFVNGHLSPADLRGGALAEDRRSEIEEQLATLLERGQILRAEIRTPDGTVLASDVPSLAGQTAPPSPAFRMAVDGQRPDAAISEGAAPSEVTGPPLTSPATLREYLPIIADGQVLAVFALWRDAAPIIQQLDDTRRDVILVTLTGASIVAVLLRFIFRTAQARITRQTAALVEATHRDALTGLLNHGSLVTALANSIEAARSEGGAITVALLDLDNFRLLNDTYGHGAGDRALVAVASLLERESPPGSTFGRYGPDEFLVIAPAAEASQLEPAVLRLRTALSDATLEFDTSERLPVSVSAGLCSFPTHGESVTVVLSVAAMTLAEAKASGGDSVRVADRNPEATAVAGGFDVLQGLVLAVDTKDRYTKRHSEDVARYGVFLAEQLGLDFDFLRTVRTAGLLHDVGKIGIPDTVLRKPGKLTPAEYEVVQQHVALGDVIVRDLPNIDAIRAGIRHHHERWDGKGYLDQLKGEEIPLIARILAIGDAFSAMTTTRPYRKALPIEEALRRLEDAAGTQLEERLVRVFVAALESVPDAPLPGEAPSARVWLPDRRIA